MLNRRGSLRYDATQTLWDILCTKILFSKFQLQKLTGVCTSCGKHERTQDADLVLAGR